MKNKELKELITSAFINSPYKWRTAKGISKDAQLPFQDVLDYLENSDSIIKAGKKNRRGQSLYSLKDVYQERTSFTTKLLNAIINKTRE